MIDQITQGKAPLTRARLLFDALDIGLLSWWI
jgi:hypothetical protein